MGFGRVKNQYIVHKSMKGLKSPPLIVGLMGAYIGLQFPQLVIGFAVVLVSVKVILSVDYLIRDWLSRRNESMEWYENMDSKIISMYYRNRAKILSKLGIIGR
jgi:hypothetical protein